MNPAPSEYSNKFKIHNIYLLVDQSQLEFKIKKSLYQRTLLNKREGAG